MIEDRIIKAIAYTGIGFCIGLAALAFILLCNKALQVPAGPLTTSMDCSYDAQTYDWQLHMVYRDRNGHAIDRSPAAGPCRPH